jgi:hypothetical protein
VDCVGIFSCELDESNNIQTRPRITSDSACIIMIYPSMMAGIMQFPCLRGLLGPVRSSLEPRGTREIEGD